MTVKKSLIFDMDRDERDLDAIRAVMRINRDMPVTFIHFNFTDCNMDDFFREFDHPDITFSRCRFENVTMTDAVSRKICFGIGCTVCNSEFENVTVQAENTVFMKCDFADCDKSGVHLSQLQECIATGGVPFSYRSNLVTEVLRGDKGKHSEYRTVDDKEAETSVTDYSLDAVAKEKKYILLNRDESTLLYEANKDRLQEAAFRGVVNISREHKAGIRREDRFRDMSALGDVLVRDVKGLSFIGVYHGDALTGKPYHQSELTLGSVGMEMASKAVTDLVKDGKLRDTAQFFEPALVKKSALSKHDTRNGKDMEIEGR